ncbi:MAG: T9SS type A sorting domain-containing protein [Bacteroidota bacterium]|nr:T9SS type A sorting domain-containing protein [Bacteroidota bacterium]
MNIGQYASIWTHASSMNVFKILRVFAAILLVGIVFLPNLLFAQNLSVAATATPQVACSQTAVQLHAEPTGGTGNYTYTWVGNPGNFSSYLQNPTAFPSTTTNFTVFINDGQSQVSDVVTVQVVPNADADAGPDATICENTYAYTLVNATATSFSFSEWATEGDGHFNSTSIINPTYYPGSQDIENGSVQLTLHAVATAPCTGEDFDQMILNIAPFPTVNVGDDVEVCENQTVSLSASASDYSSLVWSSNSTDGYFSTYNSLNTVYHLGASDISQGNVQLTLQAYSESPCPGSVEDNLIVNITDLPDVNAGNDDEICEGSNYSLSGSASGYSSLIWTTSGSGNFQNPNQPNAVYIPSESDIANGEVGLILTVTGQGACSQNVEDGMILSIYQQPTANAGADIDICENNNILLSPTVTYSAGVMWTTSGDGSFDDNTLETATYTPGTNDISNGEVTLTITADAIAPCSTTIDDDIVITISPLPIVNAGDDATPCDNSNYQLNASATNSASVLWTTSGDGVFDDASSLTAIYDPGNGDAGNGNVQLTLTAQPETPCSDEVSDVVTLDFIAGPFVDVGDDQDICETEIVSLNATVLHSSGLLWTTAGNGSFDDNTITNPHYTPGIIDIENGSVYLILTASSDSDCGSTSDSLLVTIQNSPTANAGEDTYLCGDMTIQLQGVAENSGSVVWTTLGDGSFDDNEILNPVYTLGPADMESHNAELTFTANALLPCQNPVSDVIEISFYHAPAVSAGDDDAVCEGDTIFLNATATNTNTVYWFHYPSSSNSGEFGSQDNVTSWYVPSLYDYEQEEVELYIEASGFGTCGLVRDTIHFDITRKPQVNAGDDFSICKDGVANLSGEAEYNSGVQWRTYYTNDGSFDDGSSLTTTYTPGAFDIANGSAMLILSGWATGACNEAVNDTLILTIHDYPTVSVGDDITICSSEKVELSPDVDDFSALRWTTSGNGTFTDITAVDPVYTVGSEDIASGIVTLTLNAVPNYPCSGGDVSDFMIITVKEAPVINMANLVTGDYNTGISLSPEITGGSEDYSFLWTPEDKFENATVKDATTIEFSPEGDTTYRFDFTVTDNVNQCSTTDTVRLYLGIGEVIINIDADPPYICSGGSTTLYPNASGGMGTYTYYWSSVPSGFSSENPNPTVSPLVRTTYSVIVSDGNTSPTTSIDIEVMPTPTTPSITGSTGVVSQAKEVYSVPEELNAYFNWWASNGSVIGGEGTSSSTIEWGAPGTGRVYVSKANEYGCFGDTTMLTVSIGTSVVSELAGIKNLKIYPNPFDEVITVEFELTKDSDIEISLVDIMGKEFVTIEKSHQQTGKKRFTKEIPKTSAGVYFIRLKRDDLQAMYRVIRVK